MPPIVMFLQYFKGLAFAKTNHFHYSVCTILFKYICNVRYINIANLNIVIRLPVLVYKQIQRLSLSKTPTDVPDDLVVNKASGPHDISRKMLKGCSRNRSKLLCILFNRSMILLNSFTPFHGNSVTTVMPHFSG